MRFVAVVVIIALSGCSFLLSGKRLKTEPKPGDVPICDTNIVIPTVDLIVGITGVAIGVGAIAGDGSGGQRVTMGIVGGLGVAFIVGWWYGRKWHKECEAAKTAAGVD